MQNTPIMARSIDLTRLGSVVVRLAISSMEKSRRAFCGNQCSFVIER
jgi:hypothetical protein